MKKIAFGLAFLGILLAACEKYPTPDMLYGTWESPNHTMTFREFNEDDTELPRKVMDEDQHGVVLLNEKEEAVWWLNEKGVLMINMMIPLEVVGLGTSETQGYLYGIQELTEDTLIISPITGGEKVYITYSRK